MVKQKRIRSPRFSVPNNEQVVVSIGSEKHKGTLQVLSLTGGAVRLDKRFASGTLGDIAINTVSGSFSAAIELLQMAKGKAQAFRFIAMGPVARKRLEDSLNKMRGQGLAVAKTPLDQFRTLARRVLSRRFRK
jgi:PilZ domain-containing protein